MRTARLPGAGSGITRITSVRLAMSASPRRPSVSPVVPHRPRAWCRRSLAWHQIPRRAVRAAHRDEIAEHATPARHQRDLGFAVEDALRLQDLEHRARDLRLLADSLERVADDAWAHRRRLRQLDRGLALGGAGDDAHLVHAVLLDRARHLTQAIHDLGLDALDHGGVTVVHRADVHRAKLVAPLLRLGRDLVADGLAHHVAVLEH